MMMMIVLTLVLLVNLDFVYANVNDDSRPNILIFLIDDMGYRSVRVRLEESFHPERRKDKRKRNEIHKLGKRFVYLYAI